MLDIQGNKTTSTKEMFKRLSKMEWLPQDRIYQHIQDIQEGLYTERDFIEDGKEFYTMEYNPMQDF